MQVRRALLAFVFLIIGSAFAYAAVPDPGHSWSQLECDLTMCVTPTAVGFGTTTPPQPLTIQNAGGEVLLVALSGGATPILHFKNPINGKEWIIKHADSKLYVQKWTTTGGEIVTIQDNGYVGVGTTAPAQKLHIAGDLKVAGKISECSLGVYVGSTTSSYDGNQGGYSGIDALCNSNFAGSHVCTTEEIGRSIRCGSTPSTGLWYNAANYVITRVTSIEKDSYDCKKWAIIAPDLPINWRGQLTFSAPATCDTLHKFACCRAL